MGSPFQLDVGLHGINSIKVMFYCRYEKENGMGTSNINYCDRCGNPIKEGKFPISRVKKINEVYIFGYGGYCYGERNIELCPKCSKDFEIFIKG